MKRLTSTIAAVLGSRRFLYAVFAFFALESVWVAFSAVYPMAFDEDFHVGIIKIYSHHWLPFLASQPDGASVYGAVVRDPSYLYQYLMSFPYRLIALITHSQTAQVIVLRLINVVLFGTGLWLFYRLLRRVGVSRALAQVMLALFVLIPIVPLLAGQINYDNMIFPIVAWLCLVVYRLQEQLAARRIDYAALATFVIVCALGSLVKYPFLPIAVTAALFVMVMAIWRFWGHGRALRRAVVRDFRLVSPRVRVLFAVPLVLSLALFVQRYGVNVLAYHSPVPDCDVVLTRDECKDYGPWARNYQFAASKGEVDRNALAYSSTWLQALHYRLFFTVNGPSSSFTNYPPLPLPGATAIVLALAGLAALLLYGRRLLLRQPYLLFLLAMSLLYVGALWADNYAQYLETGQPVAINGRYLLLVLIPVGAVLALSLSRAFQRWPSAKPWLATVALVLFLQGGGVLTFILRSDSSWDWPNRGVVMVNDGARRVLAPFVIEGSKYY